MLINLSNNRFIPYILQKKPNIFLTGPKDGFGNYPVFAKITDQKKYFIVMAVCNDKSQYIKSDFRFTKNYHKIFPKKPLYHQTDWFPIGGKPIRLIRR